MAAFPCLNILNENLTDEDINRYQTVYAKEKGSVAAPTAGLHFTDDILFDLKNKGVIIEYLTFHVDIQYIQASIKLIIIIYMKSALKLCIVEKDLITKIEQTKKIIRKCMQLVPRQRELLKTMHQNHTVEFFW